MGTTAQADLRQVLTWPVWRYPGAQADADGRSVLLGGVEEPVLPAGLHPGDFGATEPIKLRSSVADGFDDFRLLAEFDEADDRALDHLVRHVRQFGVSALCDSHGLPVWHVTPDRTGEDPDRKDEGPVRHSCPSSPKIDLLAAVRLAGFIDVILDASVRIGRRQVLPRWVVEQATEFEFVGLRDYFRHWVDRDGRLSADRQRQLVALAVDGLLAQTHTSLGVSWIVHRRPELVIRSATTWGFYAVETARRLRLDLEPDKYECAACGAPVQRTRKPRPGDRVYCQRPECQRVRWRRNKASQRSESGRTEEQ